MSKDHSIVRSLLAGLPIMACTIIVASAFSNVSKSLEASHWNKYLGSVLSRAEEEFDVLRSRTSGYEKEKIRYVYEINEKKYFGSRVGFGIDAVDDSISPGDAIDIYVNPEEPDISVIKVGLNISHVVSILVGTAFGLLGIYLWQRFQKT